MECPHDDVPVAQVPNVDVLVEVPHVHVHVLHSPDVDLHVHEVPDDDLTLLEGPHDDPVLIDVQGDDVPQGQVATSAPGVGGSLRGIGSVASCSNRSWSSS